MRRIGLRIALFAACCTAASCDGKSAGEKPSGLKNMAPLPIGEQVIEGLDSEPNDNFLQAANISLTGDAMQWRASLTPGDADVWRIKAKAGTIADIRVIPEGDADIAADYAMTDSESARRVYDVRGRGGDELIHRIRLTPQGGFLTVRARNSDEAEAVGYRVAVMRIESGEENVIIESEPNDIRQDAIEIASGSAVSGSMYPTGDIDIYRLNASDPVVIDFEMPDGAYGLAVYSGSEALWRGVSQKAQTIRTDLLPGRAKDMYVEITALEAIDSPMAYRFSVNSPAKIPDETEPNDTVEQAQMIQSTAQNLEFSLSSASDIDIFRIMYAPNGVYRVKLSGADGGGARLDAIDADGAVRSDVLSDGLRICDVREESGALLVRVSGQSGNVASWPLPYRLSAESEPSENFETEPNSTQETATALALGSFAAGHIFPASDVDMYRIEVPGAAGTTSPAGKLSIEADAGYGARLTLKLRDSAGYEISQTASKQVARPLRMAFDAPAGAYYLSVTGSGDNCGKPYVIRANFEPAAAGEDARVVDGTGADAQNIANPAAETVQNSAQPEIGAQNSDALRNANVPTAAQAAPAGGNRIAAPKVDDDLAQILEAAAAAEEKPAGKPQKMTADVLGDEDAF